MNPLKEQQEHDADILVSETERQLKIYDLEKKRKPLVPKEKPD